MNNEMVIIGCGTLGASLSLNLAKRKLISKLTIYDFDTISDGPESSIYPFNSWSSGVAKVKSIQFQCKKINSEMCVVAHQERVLKPLNTDQFIIDCRDCKNPNLNSKIRLSLDGDMLYIDSRNKISATKNYHKYLQSRNPQSIESANDIIINYMLNNEHTCNELRLYIINKSGYHVL
jgi:hypothetical protein